jgi:hypothetical protein
LGFNSCNSWNLYGQKDNNNVMWETSPNSLLACLVDFCGLWRNYTRTQSSLITRLSAQLFFLAQMKPVSAKDFCHLEMDFLVGVFLPQFVQNHSWTNAAEWFCLNRNTYVTYSTLVKHAILKMPRGRRCIAPLTLDLSVVRVTPQLHFTLGTHLIGGSVGLRASLDTEARAKFFASAGNQTPVVQSVVRHYTQLSNPSSIHSRRKNNKFWEELIHLLSLCKSFIWSTWT